ncbi:MAG: hypothetical protein AAF805_01180 [Planctomycetota bacterium]
MPEYAETQAKLAVALGVSRPTIAEWRSQPSFPPKTKRGWNLDRVRRWAAKNGRGEHRRGSGGKSTSVQGVSLTQANIGLKLEQKENERIKKERQLVEQAAELGEIVYMSDVLRFHARMVATVTAVHDAATDAIDRALPEQIPTDESVYREARARALAICAKIKSDVASAMEETAS